eukprot:1290884-Alexandrium_andersonii.AAC.1
MRHAGDDRSHDVSSSYEPASSERYRYCAWCVRTPVRMTACQTDLSPVLRLPVQCSASCCRLRGHAHHTC